MPTQRDISTDQDWTTFKNPSLRDAHANPQKEFRTAALGETTTTSRRPEVPLQALMQAQPGDEPELSLEEVQPLREAAASAIEMLTDEHRFIIESVHHERLSFSQLAARLGVEKTQAWRLTQVAEAALQALLLLDPMIQGKINMDTPTWNDAAFVRTVGLSPVGAGLADHIARALIERKIELVRDLVKAGHVANEVIGRPLVTIGQAAASMLDNLGMWCVEDMAALLCRKQHDYGHTNILAFGMVGVGVRCSDKVARFVNLTDKNATGTAEPLEDALVDMVGYAVIAQMLMDDVFLLELAA